jgi:pectate lyase
MDFKNSGKEDFCMNQSKIVSVRLWFLAGCLIFKVAVAQDQCKVVGWATENGGVSGGGSASPTVASDYNELKAALTSGTTKVVHISGTITIPAGGRITIQDQIAKSIIGLAGSKIVSSDMSKDGSGILYIKRSKNFIMRNIVFEGPGAYDVDGYDNLCIDDCQNFWIDHCEFHDGMDGNFDIKNMSDFISVTWCTFSYEKPPKAGGSGGADDHRYSDLIGSSDGATEDETHLNITFNYCWWGEGCRERMPRMRFGKLHMVNNLFSSTVSNHCIRAGFKADVLAVGNYFDNQKLPIDEYENNYTAIRAYNNYGASEITKNTAFTPPYSITVANPASIVSPIKTCAGAKLTSPTGCSSCSGPVNEPPVVSITTPTNNTTFDGPASISINATASDKDGTISKVEFFNGTTLLGSDNSSPFNFTWTNVVFGTYTITAKATDNGGAEVTSDPVKIVVINPSLPSLTVADSIITADSGKVITPVVFTWGGAATDVNYTDLPLGLSASKNATAKTLTIFGTPLKDGTFSVTTVGGSTSVTIKATVIIKVKGTVLADWYKFQESTISLKFVSFTSGTIETDYYDQTKPDNGVAYSPGALRLDKVTGTMKLTLRSLEVLKIRIYATGGRTLKVNYGLNGTEKTWNSPSEYSSGAHELDLTSTIPELVSSTPITVMIINSRADGGSLNIHDLYVKGTEMPKTSISGYTCNHAVNTMPVVTVAIHGTELHLTSALSTDIIGNNQMYIVNLLGKTLISKEYSTVVDISKLKNGIYFLRIGPKSFKFVKK